MSNLPVPVAPQGVSALNFGSSQLDMHDFIPPRVKVIQAMSDEKNKENVEGSFFNTLTSENYGPALRFLPVHTFKNRVLLVRKEKADAVSADLITAGMDALPIGAEGLTCRSLDMQVGIGYPGIECGACPLSRWEDATRRPPFCSETYNVAAITEMGDLIILGFSRSSAKAGRKLFTMLRLTPGAAPWRFMYEATTEEVKGELGRYFAPTVARINDSSPDPTLQKVAADFAVQLGSMVIDVTPTEEAEGPPPDGAAPWEAQG